MFFNFKYIAIGFISGVVLFLVFISVAFGIFNSDTKYDPSEVTKEEGLIVNIDQPEDNARIAAENATISIFSGSYFGIGPEGGHSVDNLPEENLVWTSDKDGLLGTGEFIPMTTENFEHANLSVGVHNITLTVKNIDGKTYSKTIKIEVVPQ